MDIGACSQSRAARARIQASSVQRCAERVCTRPALAGRTSNARANGSLRTRRAPPVRVTSANLYSAPSGSPSTKPSQTPLAPRQCIGVWSCSQPLKSPMTDTRAALGAHTRNRTASRPSRSTRCAPSRRQLWVLRPSPNRNRSVAQSSRAGAIRASAALEGGLELVICQGGGLAPGAGWVGSDTRSASAAGAVGASGIITVSPNRHAHSGAGRGGR